MDMKNKRPPDMGGRSFFCGVSVSVEASVVICSLSSLDLSLFPQEAILRAIAKHRKREHIFLAVIRMSEIW